MPYKIIGPPWYVVKKSTGERMSNSPLPSRARARKQMSALFLNVIKKETNG